MLIILLVRLLGNSKLLVVVFLRGGVKSYIWIFDCWG